MKRGTSSRRKNALGVPNREAFLGLASFSEAAFCAPLEIFAKH